MAYPKALVWAFVMPLMSATKIGHGTVPHPVWRQFFYGAGEEPVARLRMLILLLRDGFGRPFRLRSGLPGLEHGSGYPAALGDGVAAVPLPDRL